MAIRSPQTDITLDDVLSELKNEIFTDLNAVQIGTIQSFDPAKQTATIQLGVKSVSNVDLKTGVETIQDQPPLVQVPVLIANGGGGRITFPIQQGDVCIVFYNDREIDRFYMTGQPNAPMSTRKHDMSDAIAFVGFRTMQNLISGYFMGGVEISYSGTRLQVTSAGVTANKPVTATMINAGNGFNGIISGVNFVNGIAIA